MLNDLEESLRAKFQDTVASEPPLMLSASMVASRAQAVQRRRYLLSAAAAGVAVLAVASGWVATRGMSGSEETPTAATTQHANAAHKPSAISNPPSSADLRGVRVLARHYPEPVTVTRVRAGVRTASGVRWLTPEDRAKATVWSAEYTTGGFAGSLFVEPAARPNSLDGPCRDLPADQRRIISCRYERLDDGHVQITSLDPYGKTHGVYWDRTLIWTNRDGFRVTLVEGFHPSNTHISHSAIPAPPPLASVEDMMTDYYLRLLLPKSR